MADKRLSEGVLNAYKQARREVGLIEKRRPVRSLKDPFVTPKTSKELMERLSGLHALHPPFARIFKVLVP